MRLVYVFRMEDPEERYRFRLPLMAAWALSRLRGSYGYAYGWWSA